MTTAAHDHLRAAEKFFHDHIPLTRAMGLRVIADDAHGFALEAPVALNHNHLQTAFGGSINAVATLAGYGFLWLELRDENVHVVVGESAIRFLQPVREKIRAVCLPANADELSAFRRRLREKGKAKMKLQVRVEENGITAAQFDGTFIALTS
ncbi:MAG: YiiD C-terminal domain-containing protein [Chthoniobacterales bacterium]